MKNFGCIHKRELIIDKTENKLTGKDEIKKEKMASLLVII